MTSCSDRFETSLKENTMRIVVTGAAGFIGSNLLRGLNRVGIDDIVAVDDLSDPQKYTNLCGTRIADYLDRDEFYERFGRGVLGRFDAVLHQGACSDTMQHDGRLMMRANYRCSMDLLEACARQGTQLIYASSAAVYGCGSIFAEEPANERPLNVYGYSKLLFDEVVRRHLPRAAHQMVGLRYFNVYGPREQHKGRMASVALHQFNQYRIGEHVHLFGAYGGYGPGEQRRDFVFIEDVVAVNLWFLQQPGRSGIFNVGSGRAQPFNDVAQAVVNTCRSLTRLPPLPLAELVGGQMIRYEAFPEALVGRYQSYTQADLTALRQAGCDHQFADVDSGVSRYVRWLAQPD